MDKHEIIKHLDSMSDDEFFKVVPYAKHAINAYILYRNGASVYFSNQLISRLILFRKKIKQNSKNT